MCLRVCVRARALVHRFPPLSSLCFVLFFFPFLDHQEHHAWPNVPFHMLPKLHDRVRAQGARPSTGCTPDGEHGKWPLPFLSSVLGSVLFMGLSRLPSWPSSWATSSPFLLFLLFLGVWEGSPPPSPGLTRPLWLSHAVCSFSLLIRVLAS